MKPFAFEGLKWQSYYKNYVTPREWKKGAADMPFGLGAKSLYVDGTDGDDSNDGLSWKTAKQKIQSAIDIAENWTNIFIKNGTYAENVTVPTEHVKVLGESRTSVFISPDSGMALDVTGDGFVCCSTTIESKLDTDYTARIYADNCKLFDLEIKTAPTAMTGMHIFDLENCMLDHIYFKTANHHSIFMSYCTYCTIESCRMSFPDVPDVSSGIYLAHSNKNIIRENEIAYALWGIVMAVGSSGNTIFHNNIASAGAGKYLYDVEIANYWYENYIGGHTNVDNGFGIAKTPYTFTGGSDPRPVVVRNGWEFLSMGSAITNILEELELEAFHDSLLFPEDTNETVTFTAGGAINTFGAWVEIVDNNAVTFSSKFTTHDGHISALSIENANTNNKIYLLEIAYGAAKTVVVRHRFKTGVGAVKFESWRQKTLKIPAGETVYYRMKCETALATSTISLRYHQHS